MATSTSEAQHAFNEIDKAYFSKIRKRDGRLVPFDAAKITSALQKAGKATGEFADETANLLTIRVLMLAQTALKSKEPSVEEIQDMVEEVLLASPFKKTAKAYILYRDQHARIREMVRKANLDLIDRYLPDETARRRIADSGMARAHEGFNCQRLAGHIIDLVKKGSYDETWAQII